MDIDALGKVPLFRDLSAPDLVAIVAVAKLQPLKLHAVLLRQGHVAASFYVVMRGRLKVGSLTPDGHDSAVRILGPGHMVGGPAVFGNATYPVTASAMEPAIVLAWSAATISTLVARYPQLARNFMLAMASRIVELQDRCRELATERVDRRLARALLRLAEQAGKPLDGGILIGVRFSRQDLSEIAGTTLFTVSRILSQWNRDGLVKTGRQKVILLRPHDLRRIAEDIDSA